LDRSRVRGTELGRGGGKGDEEVECGPEELAKGVSSLKSVEKSACGGGSTGEGSEALGGMIAAIKEDMRSRVILWVSWGGAMAYGVITGTWPKATRVVGGEGVARGDLDGGGEEVAIASGENSTDEWRGAISVGRMAGLGGGVGRRGIFGEPFGVHLGLAIGRCGYRRRVKRSATDQTSDSVSNVPSVWLTYRILSEGQGGGMGKGQEAADKTTKVGR
jgi:hypothetical protein